jgi:hypothetical protein
MNLQVIASPGGDILWVSGALPGSVHDKKARHESSQDSKPPAFQAADHVTSQGPQHSLSQDQVKRP